ncbi:MAG: calcium-binding protein [Isosphaeraceae bacterium]
MPDSILGGLGNDILFGGVGNSTLQGAGGNDTIIGGSGNDVIFGGVGNDTTQGSTGGGNVSISGGFGNDIIFAGDGNATVQGGGGNDTLVGGQGNDIIFGGLGNDTTQGSTGGGNVSISGGTGNDIIFAGTGDATIQGGGGDDTLVAGGGNDVIFGGVGNSTLTGSTGGGADSIVSGAGNDIIFAGNGNTTIQGSAGNDTLIGGAGNDLIFAGQGNDSIQGGGGDNTIVGGAGNDIIFGGAGVNWLVAPQASQATLTPSSLLVGSPQNPLLKATIQQIQKVTLAGDPTVSSRLDASSFDGAVSLVGGGGDDTLLGGPGDDTLVAGRGNDSMVGGGGRDLFVFGAGPHGTDVVVKSRTQGAADLDFSGMSAAVNVNIGLAALQNVSPGLLRLRLSDPLAIHNLAGTPFDDTLIGNANDNILTGNGGRNWLSGGDGADVIQGGVTQVVYLDFDRFATPGLHVYSQDERDAIQQQMQLDYASFRITFTQLRPASGPYTTLQFNAPSLRGLEGGISSQLDWRNLALTDVALINVNGLLGHAGQPPATTANFVSLTTTVAAHELGHMLGLRHGDSFGPIGSGIYGALNPGLFYPGYPGPASADETPWHIMASGASVRASLFDAAGYSSPVGTTFFGEREALKLAFDDTGKSILSTGSNNRIDNPQAVNLDQYALAVPDTIPTGAGRNAAARFDVHAVDILGQITLKPDAHGNLVSSSDFYSFYGHARDVYNFEVVSRALSRYGSTVDAVIRLNDASGHLVKYYGSVAANDDSFQSQDSLLLDVNLPADGYYTLEVDTYTPNETPDGSPTSTLDPAARPAGRKL